MNCKVQKEKQKLNERFYVEIHSSIEEIREEWDELTGSEDIFLSSDYFKSLEECSPKGLEQRYAILSEHNKIIGCFPLQISEFQAKESIKDQKRNDTSNFRKSLAKLVNIRGLVAGNMLVSGEYMFRFYNSDFSAKEKFEILEMVLSHCIEEFQKESLPLNVVFTKDVPVERKIEEIGVKNTKFTSFNVEPLMVLHIDQEWSSFADYLAGLTSKYRVRARRALKKSAHFSFRELQIEEIEQRIDEYFPLYLEVFEGLDFTLFQLPRRYFVSLKRHLGDNFRFIVIENAERQIQGFYTLIHNRGELHAHFLGYDKQVNKETQLYLTMLYKMIGYGINKGFGLVDFGRTALEIKSSVGAVPHYYELYLKHSNSFANLFIGPIVNILNKRTDWEPRHPFKEKKRL